MSARDQTATHSPITTSRQAVDVPLQQQVYLEALHAVGLLMCRHDLIDVLHTVIQHAGELLGTPHGFINLVSDDGTRLDFVAGHGECDLTNMPSLAKGEGLSGKVWQSGAPLSVQDYAHWEHHPAGPHREHFHAALAVPLICDATIIGVLGLLCTDRERTFDDAAIEMLNRFGQLAAIALDNARLSDEARAETRERRHTEERYQALFNGVSDAILLADGDGRYVDANPAALVMLGYTRADLLRLTFADIVSLPYDRTAAAVQQFAGMGHWGGEVQLRRADGVLIAAEGQAAVIETATEAMHVSILHDITERKRVVTALRASEKRFRALIEHSSDGIALLGADYTIRYASPSTTRILGYTPEEFVRCDLIDLIHPDDRAVVARNIAAGPGGDSTIPPREVRMRHKDGTYRWLEYVGTVLLDDPAVNAIVVNYRDISERKRAETALTHRALHDPLTDLPNRTLFLDRLAQVMARARRRQDYRYAVFFLDCDRFKMINDSLGHLGGDQLLVSLAQRFVTHLPPGSTIARLGGDEFTVLIEETASAEATTLIAVRLQKALVAPFILEGHEVVVTASIGIAMGSAAYEKPEELLRDADTAMYQAKALGKARQVVFDPSMFIHALRMLELESELRGAIAHEELRLDYQPIVRLDTGKLIGFEALVRWMHPQHGTVPPTEFIPLAEETGLIIPLDRWVLREACRQARVWEHEYPDAGPLSVSVNLSGKHFDHPDLFPYIAATLTETGLDPQRLKLEITEGALITHTDAAATVLSALRTLGVAIHLDDFGMGYSSLSYLGRFPIDTIKIDRSFVSGAGAASDKMVAAIVALAHHLGLAVVAEGIETAGQEAPLQNMHCEYGQGYRYSRPLSAGEIGGYLQGEYEKSASALSTNAA